MLLFLLSAQLAAATLTSTPATTCYINGASCATVAITPHPSWAPAIGGTEWISIAQTGWPLLTWLPNGTVVSFSEVFSLASMPSVATVTFAADDSASLWLNGSLVVAEASMDGNGYSTCSDFAPTCRQYTTVDVLPWLLAGSNVIRFDVAQRGGWSYGLNYSVGLMWLDEPLATPEPNYAVGLLAIALAALAGFAIGNRSSERVDEIANDLNAYRGALTQIRYVLRDPGEMREAARKALEE